MHHATMAPAISSFSGVDVVTPTSKGRDAGAAAARPDLVTEELDGDLVVYDPVSTVGHVLTGGAVHVWRELERGPVDELVDRVARRAGAEAATIADDVHSVVTQLAELGLLGPAPAAQ